MTKNSKRTRKKHKGAQRPAVRRRRVRIKPHKGPFQLELPLQMPLFHLQTVSSPAMLIASSSSPSPSSALLSPVAPGEGPIQPMLLDVAS